VSAEKTKRQVPLTAVLAIGLVIVTAVAWFGVVGPKQGSGAALDAEISDYESKITIASRPKDDPTTGPPVVEIEVADLFRLTKAMPDRDDMPGVLIELNSIAVSSGVRFLSIQPADAVNHGTYYSVPVTVTFEGNYYDLTDFLFRLRNLVSVRDGELEASGRLYTLDSMSFAEGSEGFPQITATLTLSAFSYGVLPSAPGTVPPPAAPPATTGTTTTGTTTTTATTTTAENAAAAPGGNG
jgi:Tfp pilus assembly protein PilO